MSRTVDPYLFSSSDGMMTVNVMLWNPTSDETWDKHVVFGGVGEDRRILVKQQVEEW